MPHQSAQAARAQAASALLRGKGGPQYLLSHPSLAQWPSVCLGEPQVPLHYRTGQLDGTGWDQSAPPPPSTGRHSPCLGKLSVPLEALLQHVLDGLHVMVGGALHLQQQAAMHEQQTMYEQPQVVALQTRTLLWAPKMDVKAATGFLPWGEAAAVLSRIRLLDRGLTFLTCSASSMEKLFAMSVRDWTVSGLNSGTSRTCKGRTMGHSSVCVSLPWHAVGLRVALLA